MNGARRAHRSATACACAPPPTVRRWLRLWLNATAARAAAAADRIASVHRRGFTLVELILAVAIIAVLASIAFPAYNEYVERARVAQAKADITGIQSAISRYEVVHGSLPASLAAVGASGMTDPWGNPYQYVNHALTKGKSAWRKDARLNPLNSDYDLFSLGKDGASAGPLNAKASRDDVVRARNGAFVDLAANY